jgi:CSLREA domain-containing protein
VTAKRPTTVLAIAAVAAGILIAAPTAGAASITVTSSADVSGNDGACTLREAIRAATTNTASGAMAGECAAGELANADSIGFAPAVVGQTIAVDSPVGGSPGELDGGGPVVLDGCSSQASPSQPCVGLRPNSFNIHALLVNAEDVTIRGLAITNSTAAITGLVGSVGMKVANNWLGLTIGGDAELVGTGVTVIGDGAVVGGGGGGERNVFAAAAIGVEVFVADDARVSGNVFGLQEDGSTPAPGNVGVVLSSNGIDGPQGTVIGGDTAAEENLISNAAFAGIAVSDGVGIEDNRFLRNRGSGNGTLFIDLCNDLAAGNPCGVQEGVEAPAIASSGPNAASGAAAPGAVVRLYRKASASPGEVQGFLGQATADGSGKWTVTHNAGLPDGTRVTANQTTTSGNSSEMAAAVATVVPPPAIAPPAIAPIAGPPAGEDPACADLRDRLAKAKRSLKKAQRQDRPTKKKRRKVRRLRGELSALGC